MGAELELFDAVAEAARTRRPIPPVGEYRKWASKPRITAVDSPNHGCAGACPDLVNLANGHETVLDRDAQLEKFEAWARASLCGNEAFARSIYTRMNLNGYRVGRDLWREKGQTELADRLHVALRAALAHLALPSVPAAPCFFSASELEKDGPDVFVAEQPAGERARNLYGCPAVGARSANDKPAGTTGRQPPPGTPSPIGGWNPPEPAYVVTEACKRQLDKVGQGLLARGCMGHWLTEGEAQVFDDAVHGSWPARQQLWEWAKQGAPGDTFHLFIFERSTAMVCSDAHASSTTPVEIGTMEIATGRGELAVANPVHRESKRGKDTIRPTNVAILEEGGFLVAYARRVDGSLPSQRVVLGPVAELLFHGENGPGGAVLHRAPWVSQEPPGGGETPPTTGGGGGRGKGGCLLWFLALVPLLWAGGVAALAALAGWAP